MKNLLGILVLDRPKTVDLCLQNLLRMDAREDFDIILVDNGSNDETKETLRRYEKDVDLIIWNNWNTGYCFGVNAWMAKREVGQHCVQIDSDLIMHSTDWWYMVERVLSDDSIGMVAARRPTAWIDRQDKRNFYRYLTFEKINDIWCEIPINNILIAPMLVYKGSLSDAIGYENEATGWGDLESYYRVKAMGLKSVYIPDIFLYQMENNSEVYEHPQRGSHMALLDKNYSMNQWYIGHYQKGEKLYCGTRFLPETMIDPEYKRMSDENWNFNKNWRKP